MKIDPHVELAFWRELAWDTYQRGHHKLAQQLWQEALAEYADHRPPINDMPVAIGAAALTSGREDEFLLQERAITEHAA